MIHLQRLANPQAPWHRDLNPYLTIDMMPVNLTAFNGLSDQSDPNQNDPVGAAIDRNDGSEFSCTQRGYRNSVNQRSGDFNLWRREPGNLRRSVVQNAGGLASQHIFNAQLTHTFGFLNQEFGPVNVASGIPDAPSRPFPWLTWANRPFVSQNELLLVPATRSSQLTSAFSLDLSGNTTNPYNGTSDRSYLAPFGHLLNFFRATDRPSGTDPVKGDKVAHLARLLEFTHVPSRFIDTETWLNPSVFPVRSGQVGGSNFSNPLIQDPRYPWQPPFNRISNFREPGRINMNTVADKLTYDGLMNNDTANPNLPNPNPPPGSTTHPGPTWLDLMESRRGYTYSDLRREQMLAFNPEVPTFFANPFRSYDASMLVPLPQMKRSGADCTVLRSRGTASADEITQAATDINEPDVVHDDMSPNQRLLCAAETTQLHNDATRSAYFRYAPMTRLGNLVSSRSNVYAIWITVGLFEVESAPNWNSPAVQQRFGAGVVAPGVARQLYDRVYPEGYQFGKERGSDTGEIERYRMFAIVDRSIPVAFDPGVNHNVDRAILVRRRIE